MNDKNYSTHEELLEELDDPKYNSFLYKGNFFGYNLYGILRNPWRLVEGTLDEIKYAWQRIFRGWDDRTIWSIDYYLAEYMPTWIERLKETKSGIPISMFEDEDLQQPPDYFPSEEASKRAEKKYNKILDDIAEGFRAHKEICDEHHNREEVKELESKFRNAMDLMRDNIYTLCD